jgi:hypothetical protein
MLCPSCNQENTAESTQCSKCQAALTVPKPKKRRKQEAAPETPKMREYYREHAIVFTLVVWSLVPLVGLILGPAGVLASWRLWKKGHADPEFDLRRAVLMDMCVAMATTVTNWVGVILMVIGWRNWDV